MTMAIFGVYNGKNIETKEHFQVNQRFILIPIKEDFPKMNERKKILIDEMYGLLEGVDITLQELKEERLKKYEIID